MSRPATNRLKCNPPLGRMPVLQFIMPGELRVDPSYQRSLEAESSQTLIRKIAQFWNWDLCQPLVVSRRTNGELFVIDGQHRWEAAKLRGDIAQLPCVVVEYSNAADEAASFVHLNQQRRPLTKIDLFKAATRSALHVLSRAFSGQVLRYGGTIWPGIVAVCSDELLKARGGEPRSPQFISMLANRKQEEWRNAIMQARADDPNLKFARAAELVVREEWAKRFGAFNAPAEKTPAREVIIPPAPPRPNPAPGRLSRGFRPDEDGMAWCDQCDRRCSTERALACNDKFCPLRLATPA